MLGTQPQLKCRVASSPTSSEQTPDKAGVEHGVLREMAQLVLAVGDVRPDLSLGTWQSVHGQALVWSALRLRKKIPLTLPPLMSMCLCIWESRRSSSLRKKRKKMVSMEDN